MVSGGGFTAHAALFDGGNERFTLGRKLADGAIERCSTAADSVELVAACTQVCLGFGERLLAAIRLRLCGDASPFQLLELRSCIAECLRDFLGALRRGTYRFA